MGEIEIDVREFVERHPVTVQEAPEIEVKPDRTYPADPKAIYAAFWPALVQLDTRHEGED
jgi:hypothetical protein